MHTWFECKIKYLKIDERGKEKKVSEPYLVDALSFTEAEARIQKEMEDYLSGEFQVTGISRSNVSEIFPNEAGDRWFKCKVSLVTLDEQRGVERKVAEHMLVQANDIKEAFDNLNEGLKELTCDYQVPAIQETLLMDVFPYDASRDNENLREGEEAKEA